MAVSPETGDVAVEKEAPEIAAEAPIENQLDLFQPVPDSFANTELDEEVAVNPPTDRRAEGYDPYDDDMEPPAETVAEPVSPEPAAVEASVRQPTVAEPEVAEPVASEPPIAAAATLPVGPPNVPAINRVRVRIGNVVNQAKQAKNRPLLIGGGLVLGLLVLFSINPDQPTETNAVQLDPKESYETSLKRFRQYSRTYEKTGQLNAYMWAFIHCNPAYEDSLSQSVVRQAGAVLAQHQLIFATDLGNVNVLKRQEMKNLLKDRISWEVRPHPLSDENCLPRK